MGTMSDNFTCRLAAAVSAAALAAVGILAAQVKPAAAQEFDCRKAEYASERTICRSDKLGQLDERMSNLYGELMETTGVKRQRADIKTYQRQFLDARDSCGRDTDCIRGAYLDQISVLEGRLERASRRSER
jgi:uncharacterized protein